MLLSNHKSSVILGVWSVIILFATLPSVEAIDINVTYSEDEVHPNDPNGNWLLSMANAAASMWEDYLPEAGTYNIDFCYEFLDGSELGVAESVFSDISIDMDPTNGWFVDPNPLDNSEFDFDVRRRTFDTNENAWDYDSGQWLYRNLDSQEQVSWFNGNPPNVMEVGYLGQALPTSAPGPNGWAAADVGSDMFSVVLHEIGHILGVNGDPAEGDWEANPNWVGGQSAEFPYNSGHMRSRSNLMTDAGQSNGTRILPSAIDIMAVADDEDMTTISLPRRDYSGSGSWNDASRWMGGAVPNTPHAVFLRSDNAVVISQPAAAGNLTIAEDSSLQVGNTLIVPEKTEIAGLLEVMPGKLADLNQVTVRDGTIELRGGTLDVTDLAIIGDGFGNGALHGQDGVVDLYGKLINNGSIVGLSGLTTFNDVMANVTLDLGGQSGNGIVFADQGDLSFAGNQPDPMNGFVRIKSGRFVEMQESWTLGDSGWLEFRSDPATPATLKGPGTVTIAGTVKVEGLGRIQNANITFENTADVTVAAANDRLNLEAATRFRGGRYAGAGAISQQATFEFPDDTTIDVREFDWGNGHFTRIRDGDTLTINSRTTGTPDNEYAGTMRLSGGTLEVNLDSGWLLPRRPNDSFPTGILLLEGGDGPSFLRGVPLTVEGDVQASNGPSIVEADFITSPRAVVNANGGQLLLKGRNTFAGGNISGSGRIELWGNTTFVSDTAINVNTLDLDGNDAVPSTTTINPGVAVTINSNQIDLNNQQFDGSLVIRGGRLNMDTVGSWTLGATGQLHMRNDNDPAFLTGRPLTVQGTVITTGGNEFFNVTTFKSQARVVTQTPDDILRLRNHTNYKGGSYTGPGGIIQDDPAIVDAATVIDLGFFDMDGVSESTFIELFDDLTLNVDRIDWNDNRFHGRMEIPHQVKLTVNTTTPWSMEGSFEVLGSPGNVATVDGSEMVVVNDVFVNNNTTLVFEADVSGPGNFLGSGDVVFLGTYSPGASPSRIEFGGDPTFGDHSHLIMELGGTTPGDEFDQLVIDGQLQLDGTLEIRLLDLNGGSDLFQPQLGDTFEIIQSASIDGAFDEILLPQLAAGLTWQGAISGGEIFLFGVTELNGNCDLTGDGVCNIADIDLLQSVGDLASGVPLAGSPFDMNADGMVDLTDQSIWLSLAAAENGLEFAYLLGDANLDGNVDVSDFNLWNGNKFTSNTAWSAGNFNGDFVVDVSDQNVWNTNKFNSSDAAAVPEPNLIPWPFIALVVLLRRRSVDKRQRTHAGKAFVQHQPFWR